MTLSGACDNFRASFVVDLNEKVCVVTGANVGVGLETARGLAQRGASVVMTARNEDKGRRAVEDVRATSGNERVELLALDLASTQSIVKAAESFLARHDRLHVLVNNAGLILGDRRTTEDGFEATFGVNHLGHFLFTHLLLDVLRQSAPSRIINVSSDAHRRSDGLDFDDLMRERRRYSGWSAYCDSKLANILYTRELGRRLQGTKVVAHAVHPGVVATGFARDGDTRGPFRWMLGLIRPFLLTPEKGARTSLHAATSSEAARLTGRYWDKRRLCEPTSRAKDDAAAARLWDASEALLGITRPAA